MFHDLGLADLKGKQYQKTVFNEIKLASQLEIGRFLYFINNHFGERPEARSWSHLNDTQVV